MRVEGWEQRLLAVFEEYQGQQYEWGRWDCFSLIRDTIEALTGEYPWPEIKYETARDSIRILDANRCADVGDLIAQQFPEHKSLALARRGDVGTAKTDDGDIVGVVLHGQFIYGKAPGPGLAKLPRDRLIRAFKIGW